MFTKKTGFYLEAKPATAADDDDDNNDLDEVKFVGYGTTFHGNAVTNFSMNIVDENVQLYAEPLTTEQVSHFIIYQVTYSGLLMGTPLSLENNPNTALSTENTNSIITSEG